LSAKPDLDDFAKQRSPEVAGIIVVEHHLLLLRINYQLFESWGAFLMIINEAAGASKSLLIELPNWPRLNGLVSGTGKSSES